MVLKEECEPRRRLTITITTQGDSNCAIIAYYFFPGQLEDGSIITSKKLNISIIPRKPHHTVDGRNPAVPGTYKTLVNNGKQTTNLNWWSPDFWTINSINPLWKLSWYPLNTDGWKMDPDLQWSRFKRDIFIPGKPPDIHPFVAEWTRLTVLESRSALSMEALTSVLGRFNDGPPGVGLDPMVYTSPTITSWWLNHPIEKYAQVKFEIFPQVFSGHRSWYPDLLGLVLLGFWIYKW